MPYAPLRRYRRIKLNECVFTEIYMKIKVHCLLEQPGVHRGALIGIKSWIAGHYGSFHQLKATKFSLHYLLAKFGIKLNQISTLTSFTTAKKIKKRNTTKQHNAQIKNNMEIKVWKE